MSVGTRFVKIVGGVGLCLKFRYLKFDKLVQKALRAKFFQSVVNMK